jgi:hypothetical protein
VPHRVGITRTADDVTATVFTLPGCVATAATIDALHALLSAAIGAHTAWLARHGEDPAVPADGYEVEEDVDAAASGAADGEFCFSDDLRPLSLGELEDGLRLMAHARADLIDSAAGLPELLLDWRPPISAMARVDPWNPGVLTIREIVTSVGRSEFYYRTALRNDPPPEEPADELGNPDLQRRRLEEALRAASAESGAVYRPRRPWQEGREAWTARKVLRRVISHELFHAAEVRQRLTWLLLGVPQPIRG